MEEQLRQTLKEMAAQAPGAMEDPAVIRRARRGAIASAAGGVAATLVIVLAAVQVGSRIVDSDPPPPPVGPPPSGQAWVPVITDRIQLEGAGASAVAAYEDKVWVTTHDGREGGAHWIDVIDVNTNELEATGYSIGEWAGEPWIVADDSALWMSLDGTLRKIAYPSYERVFEVRARGDLTLEGNLVWTSRGVAIDRDTGEVVEEVPDVRGGMIAAARDGIWIGRGPQLTLIDPQEGPITRTDPEGSLWDIAAAGDQVIAAWSDEELSRTWISALGREDGTRWVTDLEGVEVVSDMEVLAGRLWVVGKLDSDHTYLYQLDLERGEVQGDPLPNVGWRIAGSGRTLWSTDYHLDQVVRVDLVPRADEQDEPEDSAWIPVSELRDLDREGVIYLPEHLTFVVDTSDGLLALSAITPHRADELLKFCRRSQMFEAPAHGEKFDRFGNYFGGPAPRGMDRVALRVREGRVEIAPAFVMDGPPRRQPKSLQPQGDFCSGGFDAFEEEEPGFLRPPTD